jgi:hypothetical protein
MKKIIRLTESDLARIIKRVIMEQGTTIGLANYKGPDTVKGVVSSLVKTPIKSCDELNSNNITTCFESDDVEFLKNTGMISDYSYSKKDNVFNNRNVKDDPYSYIILNNGKYCTAKSDRMCEYEKWKDVAGGNDVIKSIDNVIDQRKKV